MEIIINFQHIKTKDIFQFTSFETKDKLAYRKIKTELTNFLLINKTFNLHLYKMKLGYHKNGTPIVYYFKDLTILAFLSVKLTELILNKFLKQQIIKNMYRQEF